MANTVQTRQAQAAAMNRPVGRPRTRYLKSQGGKLLIWTPTLATRADMFECDKSGVPLESPENDMKRVAFLEKHIAEKDERIFELEQQLEGAYAALQIAKETVTQPMVDTPQVPDNPAGITPPPEPPMADLISPQAIAASRAASAQESTTIKLSPDREPDLEEVMPEMLDLAPSFSLDVEFARIEGSSNDSGEIKVELAKFARERYGVDIDTRFTLDRLKTQIENLEAEKPKED